MSAPGSTIGAMSDSKDHGTASRRYSQEIRNAQRARPSYQDRPLVPACARLEWERDGEEWVDGTATRLGFDGAIFVDFHDRRCSIIGAWLLPVEVTR